MYYHCERVPIQSWIKLHQSQAQTNQFIQKLKRQLKNKKFATIQTENENANTQNIQGQQLQKIKNQPGSATYISQIFSLDAGKKPLTHKSKHINKPRRLLFHNYAKFKSIPFSCQRLFLPKQHTSLLTIQLSNKLFQSIVQKQINFNLIAFGSKQSCIQNLVQGGKNSNQGVFYGLIIKVNQMLKKYHQQKQSNTEKKKNLIKFSLNFVAIGQNKVIDLMDLNNNDISLQQDQQQQSQSTLSNQVNSPFIKPLIFQSANQYQSESNYQLYTTFKKVYFKHKQLSMWTILVVKMNFYYQTSVNDSYQKKYINSALLIQWTKNNVNIYSQHQKYQKIKNDKPLLILNQSILQIYKLIEHKSNQKHQQQGFDSKTQKVYTKSQIQKLSNLQCFRNSLITRILKPYLLFNTKSIFLGSCSVNQEDQNDSYQTLMLGKHISKVFAIKKVGQFGLILPKIMKQKKQSSQKLIQRNSEKYIQRYNDDKQDIPPQRLTPVTFKHQIPDSINKKKKQISDLKSSSLHSVTPGIEIQDQKVVRSKLLALLQEAKQKQIIKPQNKFCQISKKYQQQKSKILKTKKQLNILKVKSLTKNIRKQILNNKFTQNTQLTQIDHQCSRLQYQQKKLENELKNINIQIKNKFFSQPPQQQIKVKTKQKIQIQKLKILKNHLKNQIQMTEVQINNFLQQKQAIKQVYSNEIGLIRKEQKSLIKKLQNKRLKQIHNPQNSPQRSHKPKIRFINQMKPFFNQINENIYKINNNKNYNSGHKLPQKNDLKGNKEYYSANNSPARNIQRKVKTQSTQVVLKAQKSAEQLNIQKLKKSRQLIRKRQILKQKVSKGRVGYTNFLDETTKKYEDYNANKRK